ncbi:MAG: hypothetical protein JXQ87_11605 [Bacteroidia bacterium]
MSFLIYSIFKKMNIKIILIFGTLLLALIFAFSKPPVANPSQMSSEEAFYKMMEVVTHQRCVNCHPSGNAPKQGDESRVHDFGVVRDKVDCQTCHGTENNPYSGVPGAPHWELAPESMKWEGLNKYEIAASILDTNRNGGKNHAELIEHLTEHELVLWAWNPGLDREPAPVNLEEYKEAVHLWFKNGAIIPPNKE